MRVRNLLVGPALAVVLILGTGGVAGAQEGTDEEPTEETAGEGEVRGEAEEECIHLLEEGGTIDSCQEAPNPILPAKNELIWGGISFLVLFGLLWKLAWPGMKQAMEGRTERIRATIDEADAAKHEAESVLAGYQSQLADARNESARIIEEARQTADALKRDLQARAETEIAELRQRNIEQMAAERSRVSSEVAGQVKELAIELAEKVVGANLDRTANLRIIDDYIASVGSGSAN